MNGSLNFTADFENSLQIDSEGADIDERRRPSLKPRCCHGRLLAHKAAASAESARTFELVSVLLT